MEKDIRSYEVPDLDRLLQEIGVPPEPRRSLFLQPSQSLPSLSSAARAVRVLDDILELHGDI
jgi:hypothetical protein